MADKHRRCDIRLAKVCHEDLARHRLIVATNRGPFEYYTADDNRLQVRRSSGWVIAALNALGQYRDLTWVSSATGDGDRKAAEKAQDAHFKAPLLGRDLNLRFVVTPRNVYHKYYSVLCNPLLWFLQHHLWSASYTPNIDKTIYDAWENGYVQVNQAFARTVAAEVLECEKSLVMLHDYHLYLAPQFIKEAAPDCIVEHFTHTPWPTASYWELLPKTIRSAIHSSLCSADIVGLQTRRFARNFLDCCDTFLEGVNVDYRNQTVTWQGHTAQVKAYPVSIDAPNLQKLIGSTRIQDYEKNLRPLCREHTIVRVDQAEPSKNIMRGFRAFDIMLEQNPSMAGKVSFLAFLVPVRTHVKQFQRYSDEINELVKAINSKHGTPDWQPIHLFFENNYLQSLAGLRQYDVLLANALADGMHLGAKEGPLVNNRDGVLVLSEGLGACEQLGQHCLTVTPTDLEGTAQALLAAINMSSEERAKRASSLKRIVEDEDITHWLTCQLEDMSALCSRTAVTTGTALQQV